MEIGGGLGSGIRHFVLCTLPYRTLRRFTALTISPSLAVGFREYAIKKPIGRFRMGFLLVCLTIT